MFLLNKYNYFSFIGYTIMLNLSKINQIISINISIFYYDFLSIF